MQHTQVEGRPLDPQQVRQPLRDLAPGAGPVHVLPATAGESLQYAGGGGGAGAGRGRLNWYQSTSTPPIGVSALVTTGEVSAQ